MKWPISLSTFPLFLDFFHFLGFWPDTALTRATAVWPRDGGLAIEKINNRPTGHILHSDS